MRYCQRLGFVLILSALLAPAVPLQAQVTTATLIGQLRDSASLGIHGATATVVHEGTGVSREAVTDANGEFVLSALLMGRSR